MIVYSSSVAEFKEAVDDNTIAVNIERSFIERLGKRPSVSEWRSWNNSMQFMERNYLASTSTSCFRILGELVRIRSNGKGVSLGTD
jgi:hypothetical protein